jgi:hypothetical protein
MSRGVLDSAIEKNFCKKIFVTISRFRGVYESVVGSLVGDIAGEELSEGLRKRGSRGSAAAKGYGGTGARPTGVRLKVAP